MGAHKSRKVFAFKIGERQPHSINHLYLDYKAEKFLTAFMYFYCIETMSGPVLVDHGFDSNSVKRLNIDFKLESEPQELVSRVGIKPEEVKKIILTHLHWDHFVAENIFPNATYYVQQKEIEFVTGPLMKYDCFRRYVDSKAIEKLVRLIFEDKVIVLNGDCEIETGVDVIHVGGHTPGTQAVIVKNAGNSYAICSDVIPRYQNLEQKIPCGIHTNAVEALIAAEKIKKITKFTDRVFPGHEPLLTEKYPRFAEGVYLLMEIAAC